MNRANLKSFLSRLEAYKEYTDLDELGIALKYKLKLLLTKNITQFFLDDSNTPDISPLIDSLIDLLLVYELDEESYFRNAVDEEFTFTDYIEDVLRIDENYATYLFRKIEYMLEMMDFDVYACLLEKLHSLEWRCGLSKEKKFLEIDYSKNKRKYAKIKQSLSLVVL